MALIKRSFLEARPTEIGKIKIGTRGKKKQTSGGNAMFLPEKLDHFLVTTMERDGKDGPFRRDEHVHGIVGDQPRELVGTLMYPEVEDNFHSEMCVYAGRRRQWTCDGEERTLRDGKTEPCQREAPKPCACKPYGRLIVQLDAQPQMGGYYVFRTHGWASTNNIQTALEDIHREFGTLYRAPVRLFMQKTEDVYTDGSQERTGWSWKVGLTLRLSPVEAREYLAAQAREALQTREQLRVEAGQVVGYLNSADVESETEIADEFHPPKGLLASVATADRLEEAVEALNGLDAPEAVQEAVEVPMEEPAEEEVREAEEPAPEEVQTGAIPPKVEMENLLKYAEEIGLEFSDEQLQRCQEGLAGTKKLQEQVINWVKDRIHKHKEKA